MQVIRTLQIEEQARDINLTYWNLPEIKGTVWQNYMLVMAQWPSKVAPESPTHNGDPTPKVGSAMSNTTMETYFQKNMSCMGCHDSSNQQGRDFAMFVSLDAYRPGVLAPGDLFSAKLSEPPDAAGALSSDPMLKSLMQFLEGAGQK
jgi:hypothetical protein